jgi:hypothetical protein
MEENRAAREFAGGLSGEKSIPHHEKYSTKSIETQRSQATGNGLI